eukprot:5455-Heterococcus_DN1.PRE.3
MYHHCCAAHASVARLAPHRSANCSVARRSAVSPKKSAACNATAALSVSSKSIVTPLSIPLYKYCIIHSKPSSVKSLPAYSVCKTTATQCELQADESTPQVSPQPEGHRPTHSCATVTSHGLRAINIEQYQRLLGQRSVSNTYRHTVAQ